MASFGYGVGVVTKDWWSYICWGDRINSGQFTEDNKRLDRCMSVLEQVGPLMVVVAGYDWCRNKQVKILWIIRLQLITGRRDIVIIPS